MAPRILEGLGHRRTLRSLRSLPAATDEGAAGPSRTLGLVLVLLGVVVLAASMHRYLRFERLISSAQTRDFSASRTDLVLVAIVGLLGVGMSVYVEAQVLR